MTAIDITKEIAKQFEGLYLKPYFCPAGFRTVGYGHLYPKGGPITKEQAEVFLKSDLNGSMKGAIRLCPILLIDERKLGAIADFVFNLGSGRLQASTLRKKINKGDWAGAKKELMKWVHGGGRVLPGLVLRRAKEATYLT